MNPILIEARRIRAAARQMANFPEIGAKYKMMARVQMLMAWRLKGRK
jgi:hypothetical protein